MIKVQALASVPRDIGFRLHWQCQREALFPLNLMPRDYGGAFWNESLEYGIEKAIRDGFDYVLTLDFDTIFDIGHVKALLKLAEENPHADAIVPWQICRDSSNPIFGVRLPDGVFRLGFKEEEFEPDLMPIDTGHFGLTMIRLKSLEKLPRPMLWAQPDENNQWGIDSIKADIYFWIQCRKYGLQPYLATKVRVGHLQQMITWPTTEFGIEQQYVENYKMHGAPTSTK